jgi:hypothetical protein
MCLNLTETFLKRGDLVLIIDDFSTGKRENFTTHSSISGFREWTLRTWMDAVSRSHWVRIPLSRSPVSWEISVRPFAMNWIEDR